MFFVLESPWGRRPANRPSVLIRCWSWIIGCHQRHRQRLALAALDDHLLRDIGLSRSQVAAEIRKPFWKL